MIGWLAAWTPTAHGAFPGENGKIAFATSSGDIHTMNPDGTGELHLATNPDAFEVNPAWAPDGARIAFEGYQQAIQIMNADGSGSSLRQTDWYEYSPSWSPDGTRITADHEYYASEEEPPDWFWEVRTFFVASGAIDGSWTFGFDQHSFDPSWSPAGSRMAITENGIVIVGPVYSWTSITSDPTDRQPNWSPDGSKIAFTRNFGVNTEIYVVNADGSGLTRLTNNSFADGGPAWSPDGTKIVFSSHADGDDEIFVMDPDGGNQTQLTHNTIDDVSPDWQPILRGYPRPKGATPIRVPLVPAFKPCSAPNRTHGAPLSFPSCAPPVPEASSAFIGIGDGDPAPAKSIGSVKLRTLSGVSPDNADVGIDVSITNVMNASDRSDYTGELRLELPLRITDRFNKPSPGGNGPGTVSDTSFFATVPCSPTADTTVGSACTLSTTADTLLPATVRGGARSIWGLGEVKLHDGGPDGDADTPGDNQLFAVQGVFAP